MPQYNFLDYYLKPKTLQAIRRTGSSLNTFHKKGSTNLSLVVSSPRHQSRCSPKDPPRLLTMFHAGSSPKTVKEQVKKNKLFFVKRHGKIEIKQRGKDGKLRPLNRPEYFENDRSATSPRHISAQMDSVERELVRNIGTEKGLAGTDTLPKYQSPTESKGTEREAEDYGEDSVFRLSAREIAVERDRAEREHERIIGTKKVFAENELPETPRRQRQSDHPAPPHPASTHPGPHQGSHYPGLQRELAGTESAERVEREHRRGESNHLTSPHPSSIHPAFQREHAGKERLREQSNHHPDPQRGLAETERAERELRRGRSNLPTSPRLDSRAAGSYHLDPQSTSPKAARGPKNRARRDV